MDRELLQMALDEAGEPSYRAGQVWEWVTRGVDGRGPSVTMPLAFLQYLAPDFHPSKVPNDELALEYLASIGRAQA